MQPDWRLVYQNDYLATHDSPTLRDCINHLPRVRRERRERLAAATGLPVEVFGGQAREDDLCHD